MPSACLLRLPLLVLVPILTVGCGDRSPRTWPVFGTVVFSNGKPVTFGIIEFTPNGSGPSARATIAADGTFALKTGDRDGALADTYRIAVVQLFLRDGVAAAGRHHVHASRLVHAKHARLETSGLERTVAAEKTNVFTIEVESGD